MKRCKTCGKPTQHTFCDEQCKEHVLTTEQYMKSASKCSSGYRRAVKPRKKYKNLDKAHEGSIPLQTKYITEGF